LTAARRGTGPIVAGAEMAVVETRFAAGKPTRALTGLTKAEVRRSRAQAPGSALWIEFVEYKDVDRTPLRMRIQDRGAARLQLRAQNVDAVVDAMKRAGLTVVSQGGTAVPIPPNLKGALVADPNNFFLTPFASWTVAPQRSPRRRAERDVACRKRSRSLTNVPLMLG
jgi:hypothetical protein